MPGILNTLWAPIFLEGFAAYPAAARFTVPLRVPDGSAQGGFRIEHETLTSSNAPEFLKTVDHVFQESGERSKGRPHEWVVPHTSNLWSARLPLAWLGSTAAVGFFHEEGRVVDLERRQQGIDLHLGFDGVYGGAGMWLHLPRSSPSLAAPGYRIQLNGLGVRGLKRFWGIPEETPIWETGRRIYNALMPSWENRDSVTPGSLGDFLIQGNGRGLNFQVHGTLSQPFLTLPGFYHEVLDLRVVPSGGFSFALKDSFLRLWHQAFLVSRWDIAASEAEEPDYYRLTSSIYSASLDAASF